MIHNSKIISFCLFSYTIDFIRRKKEEILKQIKKRFLI
jgi:hypothetical protein